MGGDQGSGETKAKAQEEISYAERKLFFRAFYKQTNEIQSVITTKVCLSDVGKQIMEKFRELPEHKQSEEVEKGLYAIELVLSKAAFLGVNVFCQLLDRYAKIVGDQAVIDALNEVDFEIQKRMLDKLYEDD